MRFKTHIEQCADLVVAPIQVQHVTVDPILQLLKRDLLVLRVVHVVKHFQEGGVDVQVGCSQFRPLLDAEQHILLHHRQL